MSLGMRKVGLETWGCMLGGSFFPEMHANLQAIEDSYLR